jgi:serine/threonine protein kinase
MRRIGPYEVHEEIGRGGMGVVYRAVDPHIGRPVAVKIIRLGDISDPEEQEQLRGRLFREARAAGILKYRGIVTIHYVGEEQGERSSPCSAATARRSRSCCWPTFRCRPARRRGCGRGRGTGP